MPLPCSRREYENIYRILEKLRKRTIFNYYL
nr:MAG TPA: hypothetical protein [Caudoviricetes sp.]